jgi:hypothetical protein
MTATVTQPHPAPPVALTAPQTAAWFVFVAACNAVDDAYAGGSSLDITEAEVEFSVRYAEFRAVTPGWPWGITDGR